ncbi:MAG: type II toxin-antitoxin system death-on-curing family toxin [Candidatus Omnitrophota bacterium]
MERITIREIEHIAFTLARKSLSYDEPIPDFGTRFPNILESCLATPFATFGGSDLFPGLISKVAALFYFMIKNHPFQNGNKRIAITALFVFLAKNGQWLKVDLKVLYNFAMWVAESPGDAKEDVVNYTQKFLGKYIVPFEGK